MTDSSDLDAEFRDRAVMRSGLRLFRPDDAIDVIRRCRDAGIRVLGIDAFVDLPGEVVQPALDHSIDFSSPSSLSSARQLAARRSVCP